MTFSINVLENGKVSSAESSQTERKLFWQERCVSDILLLFSATALDLLVLNPGGPDGYFSFQPLQV